MQNNYKYAVVEITDNGTRVHVTTKRSTMLETVKAVIARKNHYTVIRLKMPCTTV